MSISTIDQGIATQLGHYADAVVIPASYDQILVSATPGIDNDHEIATTVTGQAEQAWENISRFLEAADASVRDIVFIRLWLTNDGDRAEYVAVQNRFVSHRPASSIGVVQSLGHEAVRLQVEVTAARAPVELDQD